MIVQCPRCHARHDSNLYGDQNAIPCQCGAHFRIPASPDLASAWQCPNCGGSTSPQNNRCAFCGVYLAFARCPSCFTPVFDGSRYCHACGEYLLTPATQATKDQDSDLDCPRCDEKLKTRVQGDFHLQHCLGCGGLWIDHDAFRRVLENRGNDKSMENLLGKAPGLDIAPARRPVAYLPCPRCRQLMHRRNFASRSGIIIDECAAHGVWFDRDELAAVIRYARRLKNTEFSRPTDLTGERGRIARTAWREQQLPPRSHEKTLPEAIFDTLLRVMS